MKPDKLTVHDLFQRERRYTVPLYQRAYVWNKDEQWEPLWEDIERQAEACLESESQVAKRSHFLGAIVLNVAKIVGSGVARSEVIDGQQRLTTLQLFLAVLRDYADEVCSIHVAKLRRLTINEDEKDGSEGSFKVWPTNADRSAFRTVMTAGSLSAVMKAFGVVRLDALPRIGVNRRPKMTPIGLQICPPLCVAWVRPTRACGPQESARARVGRSVAGVNGGLGFRTLRCACGRAS